MKYREQDLEDYLWENPQALNMDGWIARQLIMPIGRLDLLGIKGDKICLVELKAEKYKPENVLQLFRYEHALDDIANSNGLVMLHIWKYLIIPEHGLTARMLYEIQETGIIVFLAEYDDDKFMFYGCDQTKEWYSSYHNESNNKNNGIDNYLNYLKQYQPKWWYVLKQRQEERRGSNDK